MMIIKTVAHEILHPLQVRVLPRGGRKAIVHKLRRDVLNWTNEADIGHLQMEFKNKLNRMSRDVQFQEVHTIVPEFTPWVRYSYAIPGPELGSGD